MSCVCDLSYRPLLPLSFVVQELAFDSDEKCLEFITPLGLTFEDIQRTKIDCKASLAALNAMWNVLCVCCREVPKGCSHLHISQIMPFIICHCHHILSLSFYCVRDHLEAVGILFSVNRIVREHKEATYFCWIFAANKDSVVWYYM